MKRSLFACYLFFFSGFAALVYETVWTRQLVLVFGATLTSASTVLAGFMAGMALGALWGAGHARRTRDPLRLYAQLELGIALYAVAFPWIIKAIVAFMETTDLPAAPVRFVLIFAALLPGTTLMGVTFPVLSQLGAGVEPGRKVGNLYAANLLGSCLGVLTTAFLLMPLIGLSGSHRLAVLINLAVGLAAWNAPAEKLPVSVPAPDRSVNLRQASACLFVSGLCGMAFEVVWLRILMPSFNNSAYGFASVIFAFLIGLGGGSFAAARFPAVGFAGLGAIQILAGLFAYLGYRTYEITQLLQIRLGAMASSTISPVVFAPLLEALLILLPLAVLQGTLLPAALRLAGAKDEAGPAAGRLYFWNTAGGIIGALAAGFWWIPGANVQNALLITIAASVSCGAALIAWAAPSPRPRFGGPFFAAASVALMCLALRGRNLPKRTLLDWLNRAPGVETTLLSYADDAEASVAVPSRGNSRHLIINGVGVTGYTNATKMMAHIPLLLHPRPERTLIICFGMGTTFRSALRHPGRVEVVDLVPSVFQAFPLFYPDAERWISDPRAALFVNDGRNHLLKSRGGYDVIVVDPSPPLYAAGTVNLYSRDFFELARRLGSESPLPEDHGRVRERLKLPGVRQDMLELTREFRESGGERAFWRLYLGSGPRFQEYLAGSPEVTDEFPRLEYPYFRSKTREYSRHPLVLAGAPPGAKPR